MWRPIHGYETPGQAGLIYLRSESALWTLYIWYVVIWPSQLADVSWFYVLADIIQYPVTVCAQSE